jgi:hypothetical protein
LNLRGIEIRRYAVLTAGQQPKSAGRHLGGRIEARHFGLFGLYWLCGWKPRFTKMSFEWHLGKLPRAAARLEYFFPSSGITRHPRLGSCTIAVMQASDTLLEEALKLPEEERARVALRLSESLSGLPDVHAHEAWAGEIARRIARLKDGTARTVTADEALSRARARLAARRA